MKQKILLTLTLISFCQLAKAYHFNWANMLQPKSGLGSSLPEGIKYNNGAIYVYGSFNDTINLGTMASPLWVGTMNYYISYGYLAKYDLSGNLVWGGFLKGVKTNNPTCGDPHNSIKDITFDQNNNIIICGNFDDSIQFKFGNSSLGLRTPSCGIPQFITKISEGGQVLSANIIRGNGGGMFVDGKSILSDKSNAIYTLSEFWGSVDFDPSSGTTMLNNPSTSNTHIAFSKYNQSTMALNWTKQLSASKQIMAKRVLMDKLLNIYVIGAFVGNLDADPSSTNYLLNGIDTTNWNIFVAKYAYNGALLWASKILTAGNNPIYCDAVLDDNNRLTIAGSFSSPLTYAIENANQFTLTPNGSKDIFCIQLNPTGDLSWHKTFGGDNSLMQGLSINSQNKFIISGDFYGAMYMNPTNPNALFSTLNYKRKGFLCRLSNTGDYEHGGFIEGTPLTGSQFEGGAYYGTTSDPSGNLYAVGTNIGKLDANPDTNAVSNITCNFSTWNTFITKLNASPLSVTSVDKNEGLLTCYPNPATNQLFVKNATNETIHEIALTNLNGQTILKLKNPTFPISLQTISAGLYLIQWQGNHTKSHQLITISK